MAISKEDHKDVKQAFGKALANKVAKVTRDRQKPTQVSKEYFNGKWQKVGFYEDKHGNVTDIRPYRGK